MFQLFLALAVLQPPHAVESRNPGAEWAHIEAGDWARLNVTGGVLALYRHEAPNQVWVRLERQVADEGILSERALFELDCHSREIRILEILVATESNLVDEAPAPEGLPTPWWPIQPQTNFDEVAGLVC